MRAYFTQRVAFGSYRTLAYLGYSVATAWDWPMEGEPESLNHVKGMLGLTCAAIEQVTIDNAQWTLAQHYMCMPEPSWAYISRSTTGQPKTPFTELADARWSAALMGYLGDVLKNQRKTPGSGGACRVSVGSWLLAVPGWGIGPLGAHKRGKQNSTN
jgi:hypothetical protein